MKNRIAFWRKKRKLTQKELGDRVGKHFVTISNIERGEAGLNDNLLLALAAALEVPPSALFAEEVEQAFALRGMSEEAAPYFPQESEGLYGIQLAENQDFYLIKSDAISNIGIGKNAVVITDGSASAIDRLKKGEKRLAPVLCRLQTDPDDFTQAATLVRQYIWPTTLIRNASDKDTSPLDLDSDPVDIIREIVSVVTPT